MRKIRENLKIASFTFIYGIWNTLGIVHILLFKYSVRQTKTKNILFPWVPAKFQLIQCDSRYNVDLF